mmetsp:Transcript_102817/g.265785  ORF Transcript_102817/g.265785 Transcript_102817/m.265785 type:complete len:276 (-) Transcript_102817:458-1285(-)
MCSRQSSPCRFGDIVARFAARGVLRHIDIVIVVQHLGQLQAKDLQVGLAHDGAPLVGQHAWRRALQRLERSSVMALGLGIGHVLHGELELRALLLLLPLALLTRSAWHVIHAARIPDHLQDRACEDLLVPLLRGLRLVRLLHVGLDALPSVHRRSSPRELEELLHGAPTRELHLHPLASAWHEHRPRLCGRHALGSIQVQLLPEGLSEQLLAVERLGVVGGVRDVRELLTEQRKAVELETVPMPSTELVQCTLVVDGEDGLLLVAAPHGHIGEEV